MADPAPVPTNWFDRIVAQHGRKFWLAFFAGGSSFLAFLIGVWVVARVPDPVRAGLIKDMVSAYFLAAVAVVTAYSASNALVDRAHAKAGTPEHTQSNLPRQSGNVQPPAEDN